MHGGRREVEAVNGGSEVTDVHKIEQSEESAEKAQEEVNVQQVLESSPVAV